MSRKPLIFAACIAVSVALALLSPAHPRAATLDGCPISLTNPDGQALALVKYDLRAAVHGSLSLVEMEMTFRNPENRQMEGRFTYTLPPGVTISRFAKEVNGKLMEGEVVERLRAQAIYTEILHTMRDPALLETDQGNRFSARVFPVPANGTVRLLLAFSKPLVAKNGVRKLTIPLAGLPKIGEFNFSAVGRALESETGTGVVLDKEELLGDDLSAFSRHSIDYTPTRDIELTFKAAADKSIRALKASNFQMVQFVHNPPPVTTTATAAPPDWSFYFDTSASGADTEAPRLQAIDTLLHRLVPVLLAQNGYFSARAFDIDIATLATPIPMNAKGGKPVMPEVLHQLRARHMLGATNLEAALKHIGAQARSSEKPCTFVLVSDGIATWGARETKDLLAALGDWPARHTLHALIIGNKQDERTLSAIVEKTRGRIVTLPLSTDLEGNVAKAIGELREPLGAHFDAYDEGTAWIYPKSFHDVRPGQELIAFSEIKEGGKSLPGFIQRGPDGKIIKDTQVTVAPVEAADFAPLLQREAYKAYLDHLEKEEQAQTDAMKSAELRKKRLDTSIKNRVLCPLTSLLVLETEQDYTRFGITRDALTDIMLVGKTGIELRKRSPEDVPLAPLPAPPKTDKPAEATAKGKPASEVEFEQLKSEVAELRKRVEEQRAANKPLNAAQVDTILENRYGPNASGERTFREEYRHAILDVDATDIPTSNILAYPSNWDQIAGRTDEAAPRLPAQRPHFSNRADPAPDTVRAQVQLAQESQNQGLIRTTTATKRPEWVGQFGEIPTDAQLADLRAKIEAAPRERRLRNAYADALNKAQKWDNLQAEVFQWLPFDPENPAVYEFLGKSATGLGDSALALRAYSSIAEIAPNRAALLARAGFLLLTAKKYDVAEAMFREALKNRQDDANIHRGLALSLSLSGNYDAVSSTYEAALMRDYNQRYGDVKRVLREEYAYILRAWRKKEPAKSDAIVARAEKAGVELLKADALRVTLCWETDANDVDLHIVDPNGEECFYQHKLNASGLELYSDQTQGLGPEVIRTGKALPGTYHIGVNYFNAGPMGVSRGIVVIMKPVDGVDENPQILPFALIEGGKDMRHVGTAGF